MAIQGNKNGRVRIRDESVFTRTVKTIYSFLRYSEFEILFVLSFVVAFVMFKRLTSMPQYNQILVKKSDSMDWWPY